MAILVFLLLDGLGVFFLVYVLMHLWLEGRQPSVSVVAGRLRGRDPSEMGARYAIAQIALGNGSVIQMPARQPARRDHKSSHRNTLGVLYELPIGRNRASATVRAAWLDKARHA